MPCTVTIEDGEHVSKQRVAFGTFKMDEAILKRGHLRGGIYDPSNKVLRIQGLPSSSYQFSHGCAAPGNSREVRRVLQ